MAEDPPPGDELYEVHPTGFVEARNQRVKALKKQGRKEEAATVAALKRPTPVAWALNQVARDGSGVVDRALAAGGAMAAVLVDDAASGPDVRDAQESARTAVADAVAAALAVLTDHGEHADATVGQRLAATVQAAIADAEVGEVVLAGRLEKDLPAPGFGVLGMMGVPARERPAPEARSAGKAPRRALRSVPAPAPTPAPAAAAGAPPDDAPRPAPRAAPRAARSDPAAERAAAKAAEARAREARREQEQAAFDAELAIKRAAAAAAAEDSERLSSEAEHRRAEARLAREAAIAAEDAAKAAVAEARRLANEADRFEHSPAARRLHR